MKKLTLNERFEVPMQLENVENGIFKMQETIISQVVEMENKALIKAIRNYAKQKATKEKENVRIILLDESVADEIIKLGIEKYEPPISNGPLGDIINHEWYVPKTDEERIQVCAENVLPEYMKAEQREWYASVKLDGTSCTAGLFEDAFLIGGRNQWYKDDNMYTTTVKKYITEEKLRAYQEVTGMYVVFQGELCGPGIQSNRLGLKEKDWFVFNVFTSDTGKMDSYTKCDLLNMLNICEYFGLKTVPLIPAEVKFDFKVEDNIDKTVEDLLNYVDGIKYRTYFKDASPNQIAEGLVFRLNDMTNSFKVVSNKFLLKGGE